MIAFRREGGCEETVLLIVSDVGIMNIGVCMLVCRVTVERSSDRG